MLGFWVAIVVTTVLALAGRALGWITLNDVVGPRPATAFIYTPDKWSFIVALIAATAGVLSITSAKVRGLTGVFISVTTVPAAGNIVLGIAFGVRDAIWGSTLQLVVNLSGYGAGRLGRIVAATGGVVEGGGSPGESDDPAEAHAVAPIPVSSHPHDNTFGDAHQLVVP